MVPPAEKTTKHAKIFATLRREIQSGRLAAGARLPSEAELVERFGASRITVGRAMRDLQAAGLVTRRVGSGSYVTKEDAKGALSFGLLIPDLGDTEIFEPICQGMMASPLSRDHVLLWGNLEGLAGSRSERAWTLARQYIARNVAGVFFAPLEAMAEDDDANARIALALMDARIPVVLLDRPIVGYARGKHDLVGIDNQRAGYIVTEHLLTRGCRRIGFVGMPRAAATVDVREAGYREAIFAAHVPADPDLVRRMDPDDGADVLAWMRAARPDGIVCANDRTAGRLMRTLLASGFRVPTDVRMVGIDDVEYAALLPTPLTTLRQPARAIGDAAISAMLQRVARPDLPTRDILVHCDLVVRQSCGPAENAQSQR